jgi:hypothetical protein
MTSEDQSISQLYTVSREQIEHYNLSIGMRLIWLNNCLAFMFGVYAMLIIMKPPTPNLNAKAQTLSTLIPYIGIAVSLFTLFDIITSIIQMHKLTENYKKANYSQADSFPLLNGTMADRFFQRLSPIACGIIFLVIWTYLALYDHIVLHK